MAEISYEKVRIGIALGGWPFPEPEPQLLWNYTERMESLDCLLYTSPSPRDRQKSRMPSSA